MGTTQWGRSPVMVMASIEANTADVPTMAPAREAPMRPTARYDRLRPPRKLKVPSITHHASTIRGIVAKSENANIPARIPDATKLVTREMNTMAMVPAWPIPRRANMVALPKPTMARNESPMAVMRQRTWVSYSPGQRHEDHADDGHCGPPGQP